jgi:hypothetical protein
LTPESTSFSCALRADGFASEGKAPRLFEVKKSVNPSEQVIVGDMVIEAEIVK